MMIDDQEGPFDRPLTEDERERSDAATGSDTEEAKGWSAEDIQRVWADADGARDTLARLYCAERGLDHDLIGSDEMRTAWHAGRPGGREYPSLLFPGTNEAGAVTRLAVTRFKAAPLADEPPRAERLSRSSKITNGRGVDPVRFRALPHAKDDTVAIVEGPEDAMTLRQVLGLESWASLGFDCLPRLSLPVGRDVVIFADRGAEAKTKKVAEKLAGAGSRVWIAPPPGAEYKDPNDALRAGDTEAIRAACQTAKQVQPPRPEGLPKEYRLGADGWIERYEEKGDEAYWVRVCLGLRVVARARDSQSEGWGKLVEITDADGVAHRCFIPDAALVRDGVDAVSELRRLGVKCDRSAHKNMLDLINRWDTHNRALTVTRRGWVDDACTMFVLDDDRVLGERPDELVVPEARVKALGSEATGSAGDLHQWRDTVAALCNDNPMMVLVVAAAFVAPLLEPLGIEGGGLHLVGISSRGKSTLLRAANSVWGPPSRIRTWRATSNGLEGVAAAANATLLALDELSEVDPREAGRIAYMVANGAGKTRANRLGAARPAAAWRVFVLSSGEITLGDKINEDRRRRVKAGQSVRLVDLPATEQRYGAFDDLHDVRGPAAFVARVRRATAEAYGSAGPAFVDCFLGERETAAEFIGKEVEGFVQEIRREHGALDGQVERVAQRFGLIAAAGVLATRWKLTGWSEDAPLEAARLAFELWLEHRGGTEAAEKLEAIRRVREFITRHGDARFERVGHDTDESYPGAGGANPVRDRAGWVRTHNTGAVEYYIAPEVWASEVVAGMDPEQAARFLRDEGYLVPEGPGRLKRKTPRGAGGQKRAYCIRGSILGGEPGESSGA